VNLNLYYHGVLYGNLPLKKKNFTYSRRLRDLSFVDTPEWKEQEEYKKLCFARFCWPRRDQLTPRGFKTWERKFEEMHNESLKDYARRKIDEQNLQKESGSKTREKV
jgi:hypothetical protein|tara:strand:- start:78 stop:398 length:321 start_codon:yes stop_codon:yes gene_type:complete